MRRNSPPAERFSTWQANAAEGPRTCATTPRGLTRVYLLFSLLVGTSPIYRDACAVEKNRDTAGPCAARKAAQVRSFSTACA